MAVDCALRGGIEVETVRYYAHDVIAPLRSYEGGKKELLDSRYVFLIGARLPHGEVEWLESPPRLQIQRLSIISPTAVVLRLKVWITTIFSTISTSFLASLDGCIGHFV